MSVFASPSKHNRLCTESMPLTPPIGKGATVFAKLLRTQIPSLAFDLSVEFPSHADDPTGGQDPQGNRSPSWPPVHSPPGSDSPPALDRSENPPSDGQQAQVPWPAGRGFPPPSLCHRARGDWANHPRTVILPQSAAAPVHDRPMSD